MLIKFITYLSLWRAKKKRGSVLWRGLLILSVGGWVVEVVIRINCKMPIELDRIS